MTQLFTHPSATSGHVDDLRSTSLAWREWPREEAGSADSRPARKYIALLYAAKTHAHDSTSEQDA